MCSRLLPDGHHASQQRISETQPSRSPTLEDLRTQGHYLVANLLPICSADWLEKLLLKPLRRNLAEMYLKQNSSVPLPAEVQRH